MVENICSYGLKKRKQDKEDKADESNYPAKRMSDRHRSRQGSLSRKESKISKVSKLSEPYMNRKSS